MLIDSIGSDHDKVVFEWRDQLHCRLEQGIDEVITLYLSESCMVIISAEHGVT